MMNETRPESLNSLLRAHAEREIKYLLMPYLSFRAYVRFMGKDKKKSHFYGNEHQVTYNQCLYEKVPHIILNRYRGYNALIQFIEETIKGKYLAAKIYMRTPGSDGFDILCREYYKGGLITETDPPLSEDECQTLYFYKKEGRLIISDVDPNKEDFSFNL